MKFGKTMIEIDLDTGELLETPYEVDIYWRIIRTNHDKSIRLLYAGTSPDTIEGFITNSFYNEVAGEDDAKYVGWKYGTSGSLEANRTNENSSTARDILMEWFNKDIKPSYNDYISYDAIYCNDRSGSPYVEGERMEFASFSRVWEGYHNSTHPSYRCGMNTGGKLLTNSDMYTEYETIGNLFSNSSEADKFYDGVGLMTVDEAIFAGGIFGHGKSAPNSYFVRNGNIECDIVKDCLIFDALAESYGFWTMSPSYGITVFAVGPYGNVVEDIEPNDIYDIRPVISIKGGTKVLGSGTVEDPYYVN